MVTVVVDVVVLRFNQTKRNVRVRTYTYADRKHIACGGKKMREWGRSLKEEEEKKNRNEILLIAGFGRKKKTLLYVIPQSTTVEVRPPLTH